MSVINELIRTEENGNISFGNYSLDVKSKAEDFEHDGDLYKVKTFKEITKLERNGMFVYESVPGTAVTDFSVKDTEVSFKVEGTEDAQITIQLEDDMEYEVFEDGAAIGGDRFGNREGLLPEETGRTYTECDINTLGADSRGAERLIFSNDGLYFYTSDHYASFTELTVDGGTVIWN